MGLFHTHSISLHSVQVLIHKYLYSHKPAPGLQYLQHKAASPAKPPADPVITEQKDEAKGDAENTSDQIKKVHSKYYPYIACLYDDFMYL